MSLLHPFGDRDKSRRKALRSVEEDDYDEKYDEAIALVTKIGQASIPMLQRRLRVGYNRAARMIEMMEKDSIVGPADGIKPREVRVRNIFDDVCSRPGARATARSAQPMGRARSLGLRPPSHSMEMDWNQRVWELGNLGRWEEAVEACNRALHINPNDAWTWNNKGWALEN